MATARNCITITYRKFCFEIFLIYQVVMFLVVTHGGNLGKRQWAHMSYMFFRLTSVTCHVVCKCALVDICSRRGSR